VIAFKRAFKIRNRFTGQTNSKCLKNQLSQKSRCVTTCRHFVLSLLDSNSSGALVFGTTGRCSCANSDAWTNQQCMKQSYVKTPQLQRLRILLFTPQLERLYIHKGFKGCTYTSYSVHLIQFFAQHCKHFQSLCLKLVAALVSHHAQCISVTD